MDAWIVDQERRRREQERDEQPRLEIPLPPPGWEPVKAREEEPQRGVCVIQIWGSDEA